ncbi:MAG: GNAT family N-acetyltransferase, partial [Acidimicrobiia bacterium]
GTDAFGLPPVAPATGPFPGRPFLQTIWEERARPEDGLLLAEIPDGLLAMCRRDGLVEMVGEPDLTDYRTPLGGRVRELVAEVVGALSPGTRFRFDHLPGEAAEAIGEGLGGRAPIYQDVAAVLPLPASFDDYLAGIGKKERHELRRKRRRFEEAVGTVAHETHRGEGWAFEELVRLHRLAEGAKGRFMTSAVERLFRRLIHLPGWQIDLLRGPEGAAACVVGYADPTGYYLYNSSYDPDLRDGSPGVVLLAALIEQAISDGLPRFDFLRGNEVYKFKMGAEPRPLYLLEAVT